MDPVTRKLLLWGTAFVIIVIIRQSQKSSKTTSKITGEPAKQNNSKTNTQKDSMNQNAVDEILVPNLNEQIVSLIEELGFILISNNKTGNTFEITFKNYEYNVFNFKRVPTFIKIEGTINSNQLTYSKWSKRFEYGQNSHNTKVLNNFKSKLEKSINPTSTEKKEQTSAPEMEQPIHRIESNLFEKIYNDAENDIIQMYFVENLRINQVTNKIIDKYKLDPSLEDQEIIPFIEKIIAKEKEL